MLGVWSHSERHLAACHMGHGLGPAMWYLLDPEVLDAIRAIPSDNGWVMHYWGKNLGHSAYKSHALALVLSPGPLHVLEGYLIGSSGSLGSTPTRFMI